MYAVEFQANIENGVIKVPEEYQKHLTKQVHVILLAEVSDAETKDLIADLLEHPLKIPDFRPLTRDEAHERK